MLGPILFLIYINDLPDVVEVLMKLFADDAKLYHTVTNSRENELQLNLDIAVKWTKDWEMFYNTDKCHQLYIGKKDTDFRYTMQTRNQRIQLEKLDKEKDLGVTIDSKLNFKDHINTKVNLANRNLGIIFRTFTYLDQEVL